MWWLGSRSYVNVASARSAAGGGVKAWWRARFKTFPTVTCTSNSRSHVVHPKYPDCLNRTIQDTITLTRPFVPTIPESSQPNDIDPIWQTANPHYHGKRAPLRNPQSPTDYPMKW